LALVNSRPLEWFSDKTFESMDSKVQSDLSSAVERDWEWPQSPAHLHESVGPTSFLQTSTGGHPLECDCERVKCNCVKRCECGLPAASENHQAAQFLELASATGKSSAPLWVDIDTNECFLETGESVGQDTHHMLDCECDKVKCNCVKHCECSLPATATGAGATATNNLLQLEQGAELKKSAPKKDQVEKTETKVGEEQSKFPLEEPKSLEQKDLPPRVQQLKKSRSRVTKEQKNAQKSPSEKEQSGAYSYEYSQNKSEKSGYSYSYSNEEYSNNN